MIIDGFKRCIFYYKCFIKKSNLTTKGTHNELERKNSKDFILWHSKNSFCAIETTKKEKKKTFLRHYYL
jgi:hypothetical protein